MIFVKKSRGGREVNMINTLSKINLSKIGWEGGRSTSIWIMFLNILFFWRLPLTLLKQLQGITNAFEVFMVLVLCVKSGVPANKGLYLTLRILNIAVPD